METPQQTPTPLAVVQGQPVIELPQDLYIPPDALEVFLETFEGPLDLLLYLIRKQNLDILDIPIAQITRQYIAYIELMQVAKLELAAEYLVMAAVLAEIKSRMLLPRPEEEENEEDPRAARPQPKVTLTELLDAFRRVLERAELYRHHHVLRERLSVRERMTQILARIDSEKFVRFEELFNLAEGRFGVVVTFIAVLELLKEALLELVQQEPFAPIHVKAAA